MTKTLIGILALLMTAGAVFAQETRGTIMGRVTDPTGAVVTGAQVVVINKAMGTKVTSPTNDAGFYQASFLIPGQYQITVELSGFKKFVRDDVEVRINDRIEIDAKLELGGTGESITITAEAPLLSTTTASAGTVVDSRRVADLPVSYGNPFELIGLATGASFTRDPRLDRPFEPTHIVGFTMDGTRANRSDVTLDGVPATSVANPGEVTASYVPPVDAIQEFKVQTANFDAQFGNTEGGVTNISIKSGTNNLHGTAYYNTMLPAMAANDWFANATSQPRADFSYKRWGGTAGAPVYIPKVYNGKNKTFFFFAYEGIKDSRPRNNGTPTVPTTAMKNGDFSQLLALGSQYKIFDPYTRRSVAGGRFQADEFPGNKIPANRFNPVGVNILKYFADPMQVGKSDGTNNFLQPNLPETADYVTYTARLDQTITDKNRFYIRGSYYDRDSFYNDYFHNLSTGNFFQFASRAGVFDDVHLFNSTTVLNTRVGYNRFIRVTEGNPLSKDFDLTSLGFPKSFADQVPVKAVQFPRIDLTGYQGTGIGSEYRPTEVFSASATLSKTQGAHFLKTGVEWRNYREVSFTYGNDQIGRFVFDGTYTRGPLDNATSAPNSLGQSVAALLLGLPTQGSNTFAARNDSYFESSPAWGFFLQDDWKVSPKLTLQLGLRWEFEQPMFERFNRSVRGFDPTYVQPFQSGAQAVWSKTQSQSPLLPSQITSLGGLTFAGIDGQPRGLYNTPKTNLMPRFGFAYQLDSKTVIRGGYGIFFGFLGERRGDVIQTGFSRNTPFVATQDNVNFIGSLSNPYPNGVLAPVGAGQGYQTYVGNNVTFFDSNPRLPYMQRWQLSFQREVRGFLFDLAYVGNRGTHIENITSGCQSNCINMNPVPGQYLATSFFRDQKTIDALTKNVPNPFRNLLPAGAGSGFTGSNISVNQLLQPYPEFGTVNHSRFDGLSWYHGMQFSLEKRFSKGYTISGNYTFSKFMQATEMLNPTDPLPLQTISDLDRPHRVTISGIYELPFGRGRTFGRNMNAVASKIVGGWQIASTYVFQSGAPLGDFGNIIFAGNINDLKLSGSEQSVDHWFNLDAAGFEHNSKNNLANNVRYFPLRFGFLRADKNSNLDASIQKKTSITESKQIVFRMDFLNAVNHPVFPAPNLDPTNANFGKIVGVSNQANYPRRIEFGFHFVY